MASYLHSTEGEAERIIKSYPFKVRMGGFEGDTLSLAKQGWGLSMRQYMNPMERSPMLQLAIQHDGLGLYGLSNLMQIDRFSYMSGPQGYREAMMYFSERGFEICNLSPNFRVRVQAEVGLSQGSFLSEFQAIDPYPQMVEYDLADLKFFKAHSKTLNDIVLLPEQVPEAMKLILQTQEKQIAEIKKREKTRKNYEDMLGREGPNLKPGHEVHAQIITLVG